VSPVEAAIMSRSGGAKQDVGFECEEISLSAFSGSLPLNDVLANPQLQLFNSNNVDIGQNDNWKDAPNKQEIINSGRAFERFRVRDSEPVRSGGLHRDCQRSQ
jgi:hypothetical protein